MEGRKSRVWNWWQIRLMLAALSGLPHRRRPGTRADIAIVAAMHNRFD
jgi:hypothetical protein